MEREMDAYSKTLLTVIAVALSVIALQGTNVIAPAWAASGITKIALCDEKGSRCLRLDTGGRLRIAD